MADILFSTCVADAEYDELAEELTITFQDGTEYIYEGVTFEEYGAFMSAGSTGQYFNYNIRNSHSWR